MLRDFLVELNSTQASLLSNEYAAVTAVVVD